MNRLQLEHVSKSYKNKQIPALQDFSYSFDCGIYGLLGPNGAGKSTLLNMIAGILTPDEGSITYGDQAIREMGSDYRAQLGFMPQQQTLFSGMSVQRFMYYFAALKGLSKKTADERIPELLHMVNLTDAAREKTTRLSAQNSTKK